MKDDPESFSVALGFSKGFLYQHVPILFSEEAGYKGFISTVAEKYDSMVIIISKDDLKVYSLLLFINLS